jgi:hypothetical protein
MSQQVAFAGWGSRRRRSDWLDPSWSSELLFAFSGAPPKFLDPHIHSHLKAKRRKSGQVP